MVAMFYGWFFWHIGSKDIKHHHHHRCQEFLQLGERLGERLWSEEDLSEIALLLDVSPQVRSSQLF